MTRQNVSEEEIRRFDAQIFLISENVRLAVLYVLSCPPDKIYAFFLPENEWPVFARLSEEHLIYRLEKKAENLSILQRGFCIVARRNMLYSQKTLFMLEFDKITALLADCALTEGARETAMRLTPTSNENKVMRKQQITADARRLAETKGYPSFGGVRNVSDAVGRAQRGACLQPKDLLEIAALLRVSRGLVDYIRADKPFETVLDETFESILPNKHLEEQITRAIVSEEMIADEASPELAEIRRKNTCG